MALPVPKFARDAWISVIKAWHPVPGVAVAYCGNPEDTAEAENRVPTVEHEAKALAPSDITNRHRTSFFMVRSPSD